MNNKTSLIGLGLIFGASLGAMSCGNPVTAANNAVKGGELLHTWTSECKSSDILDVSMKESYAFNGALVTLTREYHSKEGCKEAAILVAYKGSFEIKGQAAGQPEGVKNVDMNFENVTVKPVHEEGRKLLDKLNACGQKEWVLYAEVDMTAKSRAALCPIQDTPFAIYDIFLVANDQLQLGKGGDKNDAARRPSELDDKKLVR